MRKFAFVVFFVSILLTGACVKTASTAVGTAAKTTAGISGNVVEAAFEPRRNSDEPRPFDETRNAMADVNAALERAAISGKNVLLVLGGNWCHDSRGLAAKFERGELAQVITDGYELVWVDVGYRDRNLDLPRRFGVLELVGTPTVLILSPEGELLNGDSVHDWRTAYSKPYDETLAYFERFAGGR